MLQSSASPVLQSSHKVQLNWASESAQEKLAYQLKKNSQTVWNSSTPQNRALAFRSLFTTPTYIRIEWKPDSSTRSRRPITLSQYMRNVPEHNARKIQHMPSGNPNNHVRVTINTRGKRATSAVRCTPQGWETKKTRPPMLTCRHVIQTDQQRTKIQMLTWTPWVTHNGNLLMRFDYNGCQKVGCRLGCLEHMGLH